MAKSNPDLIKQAQEKIKEQAQPTQAKPQEEPETELIDTSSRRPATSANPIVEEIEDLGFSASQV